MNDILQLALNNKLNQDQIIEYLIQNGADEQLLQKLGYSAQITASFSNSSLLDYVKQNYLYNKALYAGILALMISTGKLSGYTIEKGDTLWGISRASNCNVQELYKLNPSITKNTVLRPGMKIVVPSQVKKEPVDNNSDNVYVVQRGDTFSSIAKKFNIDIKELQKINPQITNINRLSIGDKINLNVVDQIFDIDAAIKALKYVETKSGKYLRDGDNGRAVGVFQLWTIFVDEYHRLGGNKDYKCHVVDGVAQQDDVRKDEKKSQEIVRFVIEKLGYKSMRDLILGFNKVRKNGKSVSVSGWNGGASDQLLKKYMDAYDRFSKN